ncbi:MAG: NADH-ubiquinone oxidoreductase-F iron-sulfur binding region domain-containing protein, partial [Candidatus Aenigmatarchaeota archaeon]
LGAGAYICGEESAILESIEGNRPRVRKKPPYPSEVGLYKKPTCINNVETLSYVPLIMAGVWDKNLLLFSLSGDLKKPGVYEFAAGTKLGVIISAAKPKPEPKAIYFGASGGCLPYNEFKNTPVNDETICKSGANLGARSLIVAGENRNIAWMSKILAEFFVRESCGYCTPCREGNFRILEILKRMEEGETSPSDLQLLKKLAPHIRDTSFCALGRSSTNHILCGLKFFGEEFKNYGKKAGGNY